MTWINKDKYLFCCSDVHAVWSEDHALAWHLEEKFRENSAAWALDKCIQWDQLEKSLPSFLDETIDCPCTLAQARADTGRFHVRMPNTGKQSHPHVFMLIALYNNSFEEIFILTLYESSL